MRLRSLIAISALLAVLGSQPALGAEVWIQEPFEVPEVTNESGVGLRPLEIGHMGSGLRSVIRGGTHRGTRAHWTFSDYGIDNPEELYWRYWIRFPESFHIRPPMRGKLPGPAHLNGSHCLGGQPSTASHPCFSARMLFSRLYGSSTSDNPDGPDDQTVLGYYVYHLDSPPNRGDIWTWDRQVATLEHGPWYCVEGHIRLNTPGERDGVLTGWVEEALAFERTDLAFRRSGEGSLDIESFWFDVYYGGKQVTPHSNEIHFDSMALGPERIGCDDSAGYSLPFTDDDDSPFETDIQWLFDNGVANGCGANHFCPNDTVTRGQMAAFLRRAVGLEPVVSDQFTDDNGTTFEHDIGAIVHAGLTHGCNPPANDLYCPNEAATRGQLALFLSRAFNLDMSPSPTFTDVTGHPAERAVAALSERGVTRGCNPPDNTQFCPDAPVTRAVLAAMLRRTIEAITPPPPVELPDPPLLKLSHRPALPELSEEAACEEVGTCPDSGCQHDAGHCEWFDRIS